MPNDAYTLKYIADELRETLRGGKVNKVVQPENDEIVMTLYTQTGVQRLLLSANASLPRAHLTVHAKDNPLSAPSFVMALRKHLVGGTLTDIVMPENERILSFRFLAKNELSDEESKQLIIEIMGKHSNIILLDSQNKILSAIKSVSFDLSAVRQILTGLYYESPKPRDGFAFSDSPAILTALQHTQNGTFTDFVLANIKGLARSTAEEINDRAFGTIVNFPMTITQCQTAVATLALFPNIPKNAGLIVRGQEIIDYYPFPYGNCANSTISEWERSKATKSLTNAPDISKTVPNKTDPIIPFPIAETVNVFPTNDTTASMGKYVRYPSINTAADKYYYLTDKRKRFNEHAKALKNIVKTHIAHSEKKCTLLEQKLRECEKMEEIRIKGELLTANIYKIKTGDTSVTVQNYYDLDEGEIKITLDARLTPAKNAQSYFKRYTKLKTAKKYSEESLQTEQDLRNYLYTVEESFLTCTEIRELEEIESELLGQGIIKKQTGNKPKKSQKAEPSSPLSFNKDGFTILVGKNNIQNDTITFTLSSLQDIWFHTKDIHGSHTLILTAGKPVPENIRLLAAQLAAYYSKARGSGKTAVDYTLRKYVKKPRGSKPGFVIYSEQKTLYVTPDNPFDIVSDE